MLAGGKRNGVIDPCQQIEAMYLQSPEFSLMQKDQLTFTMLPLRASERMRKQCTAVSNSGINLILEWVLHPASKVNIKVSQKYSVPKIIFVAFIVYN